jgi:hypothetical protein
MTDLPPVHQIAAMEDRQPGEKFEAGVDEKTVLTRVANTRVGSEAGDDGIGVGCFHKTFLRD